MNGKPSETCLPVGTRSSWLLTLTVRERCIEVCGFRRKAWYSEVCGERGWGKDEAARYVSEAGGRRGKDIEGRRESVVLIGQPQWECL